MREYAFVRAVKKCRLPVVTAAAVSMTHWIAGQLEHPMAKTNCKVICARACWMGTGRTQQDGGVMLKTGTERVYIMNTTGPGSEVDEDEVVVCKDLNERSKKKMPETVLAIITEEKKASTT